MFPIAHWYTLGGDKLVDYDEGGVGLCVLVWVDNETESWLIDVYICTSMCLRVLVWICAIWIISLIWPISNLWWSGHTRFVIEPLFLIESEDRSVSRYWWVLRGAMCLLGRLCLLSNYFKFIISKERTTNEYLIFLYLINHMLCISVYLHGSS